MAALENPSDENQRLILLHNSECISQYAHDGEVKSCSFEEAT